MEQQILQGHGIAELGRVPDSGAGATEIEDLQDMGMIELSQDLDFPTEAQILFAALGHTAIDDAQFDLRKVERKKGVSGICDKCGAYIVGKPPFLRNVLQIRLRG